MSEPGIEVQDSLSARRLIVGVKDEIERVQLNLRTDIQRLQVTLSNAIAEIEGSPLHDSVDQLADHVSAKRLVVQTKGNIERVQNNVRVEIRYIQADLKLAASHLEELV